MGSVFENDGKKDVLSFWFFQNGKRNDDSSFWFENEIEDDVLSNRF